MSTVILKGAAVAAAISAAVAAGQKNNKQDVPRLKGCEHFFKKDIFHNKLNLSVQSINLQCVFSCVC